MNNNEFDHAIDDFEEQVRRRLPAMINVQLAHRGNREQEVAFQHFVDGLKRQRKNLLRELGGYSRQSQKISYFNATYNMDSQLRSMENRAIFREKIRAHHLRSDAPLAAGSF